MKQHDLLLHCFVHERKHRLVKRFVGHIHDTSRGCERSLIAEISESQFAALEKGKLLDGVLVEDCCESFATRSDRTSPLS